VKLTRAQLERRKTQAVRFTRDVLGDPERADEIEAQSLEDYAERRKVKLLNSFRRNGTMARGRTKADLEVQIADRQDGNQDLQDQLDTIADIVAPADEDDDEYDDSGNDSDDDGDDDGDDDQRLNQARKCGRQWRQETRRATDSCPSLPGHSRPTTGRTHLRILRLPKPR
jgi:hypothetical protein